MAQTDEYAYENEGNSRPLSLNQYQQRAMTTCMPTSANFSYMMLNLVGEVGEFNSKVAKMIRKGDAFIGNEDHCSDLNIYADKDSPIVEELKKEAGDILWQLSGLCTVMGWKLEDVAQQNLEKLASRQERNVIDGDGDNR